MDKHEQIERQFNDIDRKVESMLPQVSQLTSDMTRVINLPEFVEHSLPLWMLMETSEFISDVFGKTSTGRSGFLQGVAGSDHLIKIISY